MKPFWLAVGFLSVHFFVPMMVIAAQPPDSGQILQEQNQTSHNLPQQLPETEGQPDVRDDNEDGTRIAVSGFEFSGLEGIATEAELQDIVSPAIGQNLGIAKLKNLVDQVTNYLRDKGYFLARAYLPKQEIVDGVVKIAIIAGQVQGTPTIRISEPSRINQQLLSKMAISGAPSGQALQQQQLERSLLLMNDLPGISARSILEKGEAAGSTQVTIAAQEGPLLNGVLSFDNFGNRYTGSLQANAQAALNDLSGYGDQLALSLTKSQGLKKGMLSYGLPLGASGLKSQFSYTALSYELGKELKNLDSKGIARTLNANLSYPIIRRRALSLWQGLQYEYRTLDDKASGTPTKERTLHVISTNTSVNQYDQLGGGGLSNVNVSLTAGDLDLGLAVDAAADASTARTTGRYVKLNYALSRLQRLTKDYTLFGSISGQFASQNLDSSEKYQLGGPSGVRSYPVGEASGDEGLSITTELRYNLPRKVLSSNLQMITFLDTGRIKLHDSPWTNAVTTATGKNSYWLSGLGFGVNLDQSGTYAFRASYAHTLGNNAGRSADDKNADNKDNDNRVWLQAIIWF